MVNESCALPRKASAPAIGARTQCAPEVAGTAEKRMTRQGGFAIDRSPLHLLHRTSQCVELFFQNVMKGGLTPRQLAVMRMVAAHQGVSQTDIVERTGIDRSTTADLVRRLVKNGWLRRRRSRVDARAYEVKLTEAGTSILPVADRFGREIGARVLNALPTERREAFMAALGAVVAQMEAEGGERPPASSPATAGDRPRSRP
jgi:DNA-binding MarR family transcriptional regulator